MFEPFPCLFPLVQLQFHFLFHINWRSNYSSHHFFFAGSFFEHWPFFFWRCEIGSVFVKQDVFLGLCTQFREGFQTTRDNNLYDDGRERWSLRSISSETRRQTPRTKSMSWVLSQQKIKKVLQKDGWTEGNCKKKASGEWPANFSLANPKLNKARGWACDMLVTCLGWIKIPELNRHWKGGGWMVGSSNHREVRCCWVDHLSQKRVGQFSGLVVGLVEQQAAWPFMQVDDIFFNVSPAKVKSCFFLNMLICQSSKFQPAIRYLVAYCLLFCSKHKDSRLQFSFCRLLCTPHATMAYQSDKAGRTGWSENFCGGDSPFWNKEGSNRSIRRNKDIPAPKLKPMATHMF